MSTNSGTIITNTKITNKTLSAFTLITKIRIRNGYGASVPSLILIINFNAFTISQSSTQIICKYQDATNANTVSLNVPLSDQWLTITLRLFINTDNSIYMTLFSGNTNKASTIILFDPSYGISNSFTLNANGSSYSGLPIDYSFIKLYSVSLSDGLIFKIMNDIDLSTNTAIILVYYDFRIFYDGTNYIEGITGATLPVSPNSVISDSFINCGKSYYFDTSSTSCQKRKNFYMSASSSTTISLPINKNLSSKNFSFEIWVLINVNSSGTVDNKFISTSITTSGFAITLTPSLNLKFTYYGTSSVDYTTTNTITTNTWYYLAVSTYTVYSQRAFVYSTASTQNILANLDISNWLLTLQSTDTINFFVNSSSKISSIYYSNMRLWISNRSPALIIKDMYKTIIDFSDDLLWNYPLDDSVNSPVNTARIE